MPVDASIQDLAKAINTSWRKTTDNVLETARLCASANKKLKVDERKRLLTFLECGSATFSKLAKIGARPELQSEPVKSRLPPNYSIVYEVAKLPAADLDDAVGKGIINHKMTRADITTWLAERKAAGHKVPAAVKSRVIATLQVPSDYDDSRQAQLEKELEKLRSKFGFSLERPFDPMAATF